MKKYREVKACYELIIPAFIGGDMKLIQKRVRESKDTIQSVVRYLNYLGRSRDIETDKFFDLFSDFADLLDDLVYQVERDGNDGCIKRKIAIKLITKAKKKMDIIESDFNYWKTKIGVSDSEYDAFDPSLIRKKEYHYKQTLPISSDALDVRIELDIQQNKDRTISITGNTNLFDKASLMINIRTTDGYTKGGNKAIVRNGIIDFGRFTIQGNGYPIGEYKADVSLSLSCFQDPDFVKMAGREYENMTGTLVRREGIGPSISYSQHFLVVEEA